MPCSSLKPSSPPSLGLLMLQTTFPRIRGDVGHEGTFDFPVRFKVVKDTFSSRVVYQADPTLIDSFIHAAKELEDEGAGLIGTSCGFLVLFQEALARAVQVPVFSSSLLQVPMLQAVLGAKGLVGILTACADSLGLDHLRAAGIDSSRVAVAGLEQQPEFSRIFLGGAGDLDVERCRQEVVCAARNLAQNSRVRAIVLECTNLPPYSDDIRRATGLPVFDVCSMLNTAYTSLYSSP
ncbi:MAG: aspartate/glutamate racemase family protein [Desulfovermiculus sp.]|nr:aspartate/glutamate racemase family protein [Desulfovermiculus sp.]